MSLPHVPDIFETGFTTVHVPQDQIPIVDIFSHSKDVLFALQRERDPDHPIVFVAHSLGGIILKEVRNTLTLADASGEPVLVNIVKSTAAVIFLGTPHRGSSDMAAVGEIARRVASVFMVDTNKTVLDALGLRNSDLERCQDSFTRLWSSYGFKVKTFQEGLPITGLNLGLLNEKIVPNFSSLLGDPREHAETLQANHMDMCRFLDRQDPNYRKVSGELRSYYRSISNKVQMLHRPEEALRRG
ncbi:MAG: hypothetical protein Q9227_002784 [Pyrenula ochraceoflavens]